MDKLMVDCPDGGKWLFFADNENRLILKRDGAQKTVMENVSGGFDGVFDSSGNFCVAAATSGGIECLLCDKSGERSFVLMTGKRGRLSGVRIFCINGRFSLWYCLEYEGNALLVNQFFDASGQADAPFAVDTLGYKKCFSVCCDSNYDTHIFYVDKDEKVRYLTHRWNVKKFLPETEEEFCCDDVVNISSIYDGKGIHVAFVAKKGNYYGVYHKEINFPGETVLGFGVGAGCHTAVTSYGEKICVYWCDNYESCECESIDGGKNFSKPRRINSLKGGRNTFARYRTADNVLCMCVNRCIVSEESGKMLHEKEISQFARKLRKDNDMGREIIDYSREAASELKVGIDLAAKLDSIETQLMKIVCILESALPEEKTKSDVFVQTADDMKSIDDMTEVI